MDNRDVETRTLAARMVMMAADDLVARVALVHSAAMVFGALAVEQADPVAALNSLLDEFRAEAVSLLGIVRAHEAQRQAGRP